MSRGLAGPALTAATSEVVPRCTAIEMMFASGPVRACSGTLDIVINGNVFFGVGLFGSVAGIEEGADLRSYGITAELSGIPRDMVALAMLDAYQGRRATLWEVQLNAADQPLDDPTVIFRGRMDQMEIALGQTATVRLRIENRLADWERARVRRYTAEDQERVFPDDPCFRFIPATAEKEIIWPSQTFFQQRR